MSGRMDGTVVLDPVAVERMTEGLRRIASLGSAVCAVSSVIEAADRLGYQEECDRCAPLVGRLQSGYVLAGLNVALDVLGNETSYQAERLENLLIDLETSGREQLG